MTSTTRTIRGEVHAAQRVARAERKSDRQRRSARHGVATRRMVRDARPTGRAS